ncbi:hypothetical protein LINPERHAP2_LOCUS30579, partial [Linum perenne]
AFRIADLQERIFAFKQVNESVSDYFTQLKYLWDELANFRPIPACDCASVCSCILASIRAYQHNDFVIRFLRGLSESFASARSSIMLMEPLPSVNRAFSMMLQQERQVAYASMAISSQIENMAFLARSGGNYAPRPTTQFKLKGKKPICSYCGYVGHTAEVCYKKNGYPPGYKPRPRVQPQAHCVSSYDDRSQLGPPVVLAAPSDAHQLLSAALIGLSFSSVTIRWLIW